MVQPQATDGKIIEHMHFVCWIIYAIDINSEYVILIAFPWQKWLNICATILHLYIYCLSCCFLLRISQVLKSVHVMHKALFE
jgi:hypothetical protein